MLGFARESCFGKLSDAQRFGRIRARKLLLQVLRLLGEEAFFLCATAIAITRLARISDETVLEMHQWWNSIGKCPNGLIVKAKEICNDEFKEKYAAGEIQLAYQWMDIINTNGRHIEVCPMDSVMYVYDAV
jgi:hypothetical protein